MPETALEYISPRLRPLAHPIESLTLDPRNARRHTDKDLDETRKSLLAHGMRGVVIVQKKGSELIVRAGNGRVMIARQLGWTHLPCDIYEEDDAEAVAFAIRHNKTGENAEWDTDVLASLKEEFSLSLDELGFDQIDLSLPPPDPETEPEEKDKQTNAPPSDDEHLPTERPPPRAKVGDVLELGPHTLHCDDCIAVMGGMDPDSIDAVVTDPPYGLSPDGKARTWDDLEVLRSEGKGPKGGFMGKEWDAGVPGITWARSLFRVMKPGAHAVIFSANRTIHRLTCALEDAGFDVRDQIGWVTWSGFPKSRDVSKAIDEEAGAEREVVGSKVGLPGYSTAPDKGRGVPCVAHGDSVKECQITAPATPEAKKWDGWGTALKPAMEPAILVRKPISESTIAQNVLKHGTGALNIDACRIGYGDPAWPGPAGMWTDSRAEGPASEGAVPWGSGTKTAHDKGRWPANIYATPKASRSEREEGCDSLDPRERAELTGRKPGSAGLEGSDGSGNNPYTGANWKKPIHNYHPTVKPRRLIEWLVTLVTPPEGVVFDPFAGSGTIFVAATGADRKAIGVELDPGHCDICEARAVSAQKESNK